MHRSRLSTLLIDVPAEQAATAATFWSAALGVPAEDVSGEPQFTSLPGAVPELVTAVQALGSSGSGADGGRYHLDIETDDVAAETARLTALGAVEVAVWQGCHTMRAPGGQLLCVIHRHSGEEFDRLVTTWP